MSPAPAPPPKVGTPPPASIGERQAPKPSTRPAPKPRAEAATVKPAPRARAVKRSSASPSVPVQGTPPESPGFFGPIGSAFNALNVRDEVVPAALIAMAALAILLLTLASAPLPARTSKTGAMLVHMRGSMAAAGTSALLLSLAMYLLL